MTMKLRVLTANRRLVTIVGWTVETLLLAFPWFVKASDGVWMSSADLSPYETGERVVRKEK